MTTRVHQFYAVAFVENLSLKQLAPTFPEARLTPHELFMTIPPDGGMYIFPFGAVVFFDISADRREAEMARLHRARHGAATRR